MLDSQLKVVNVMVPKGYIVAASNKVYKYSRLMCICIYRLVGGDNIQFLHSGIVFAALIPPGLRAGQTFQVSVNKPAGISHCLERLLSSDVLRMLTCYDWKGATTRTFHDTLPGSSYASLHDARMQVRHSLRLKLVHIQTTQTLN